MDRSFETVTSFKYLDSLVLDEGSKHEKLSKTAQTTAATTRSRPVWNNRNISLSSKIQLMHFLPHPSSCVLVNQRPCYKQGSLCQDPAGNWTTQRPADHRKETHTGVVWTCLPFIRSGRNHLARHSKRKKTRQTEKEVGR